MRELAMAIRAIDAAISVSPEPVSMAIRSKLIRKTIYLLKITPQSLRKTNKAPPIPKSPGEVKPPEALETFIARSAWDPEPPVDINEPDGCRALLLGILRRAAYDWVLYKSSPRISARQLADEAHHWLFEEDTGTRSWNIRSSEGRLVTAFVTICESLELDPDTVREHVRGMTIKGIMSVGRPPERHKFVADESISMDEMPFHGSGVRIDDLPSYDPVWHEDSNKEFSW